MQVDFNGVCGYASSDPESCPSELIPSGPNLHQFNRETMRDIMKEAFTSSRTEHSRHIYLATTDGTFLAYPADVPLEDNLCKCASYDPRFRYYIRKIYLS